MNATSWNVENCFEKPPEGSDDEKNVQDDVIVNVERCTKERLEDANMNSRGAFKPSVLLCLHIHGVCKDANRQPSPHVRVFADAISFSCQLFHGFKNPRLFALRASRLPDGFYNNKR